jgi:hypothetical protein
MVRRTFGPKMEEVTRRSWRKLHNEQHHNLYTSPNIIMVIKSRRMRWVGRIVHKGEINAYNISVGKHEGERTLGIPRYRYKDNSKMDLKGVG